MKIFIYRFINNGEAERASSCGNRLIRSLAIIIVFMMTFAGVFNYGNSATVNSNDVYGATATVQNATGLVNASGGAVLRSGTTIFSKKLKTMKDNSKLTIYKRIYKSKTSTKASKVWYYVKSDDTKGYVRSDLVDNIKYTAVSGKVTAKANYRVGAGTKMTVKGSLAKGKSVMVYLKATPVSSTKGSSSVWYRVKVGNKYYYMCSSNIDIVGSIFVKNPDTSDSSDSTSSKPSTGSSSGSTSTSGNKFEKMTDAEFTKYLTDQGFTSSYRTKLLKLHKAHPNWVFKAKKTDIAWSSAVSKESANGVSLIEGSQPVSYRATDSNSFRNASLNIYKTASTSSSKVGTIASNTKFTLMDEVWSGTTRWMHIKTSGGTVGYIKKNPNTQSFTSTISGTTTSEINMRSGAGTSNGIKKSLAKNTSVSIVLQTKDGNGKVWYKVKNGSGYGYVSGSYVKVNSTVDTKVTTTTTTLSSAYPIGKVKAQVEYRATPDTAYPAIGKLAKDTEITVIARVSAKSATWYKVYNKGSIVYVPASSVELISGAKASTASLNSIEDDENEVVEQNSTDKDSETVSEDISEENSSEEEIEDTAEDPDDEMTVEDTATLSAVIEVPEGSVPALKGTTNTAVNYRKGAGTSFDRVGTLDSGTTITITGTKMNGTTLWYSFTKNGATYYLCAEYVNLKLVSAPADSEPTVKTSTSVKSVAAKPSSLTGTATIVNGTYIAKDGSNWFNAKRSVVAYYMDPRNFLNEDRVYMFEDLSYQKEYQTASVVTKVLAGSKLPGNGFTSKMFVNAGSSYNISPVFLAARARQETGGGSVAINGTSYNGTVVYNPFNIGATSSANPVWNGMKYAYNHGWTTQAKAVSGGAQFMASGYVNAGQNSNYYQRFNVANGLSKVATHQYMTNIQAPYHESYSSGTSYKSFGITDQPLTFVIPVFKDMPSSTKLPG